jgi:hypothetical protein
VASIPVESLIDMTAGAYTHVDGPQRMGTLFRTFAACPQGACIVGHFHGGLVSAGSAEETAQLLYSDYANAKAVPAFFVWRTDLKTTVTTRLSEIVKERDLWTLVRAISPVVFAAIPVESFGRGESAELPISPRELENLEGEQLAAFLDSRESQSRGADQRIDLHANPLPEETQFKKRAETELSKNDELQAVQRGIAAKRIGPASGARGGFGSVAPLESQLDEAVIKEIEAEGTQEIDARAAGLFWTLIRHGAVIAWRATKRFYQGRDHGLYDTVVQEVLREVYADKIGTALWNSMKRNSIKPFQPKPPLVGIDFLNHLCNVYSRAPRIVLVGHSAGSIFIGHLLEAFDQIMPANAKVEVIFLAPACTYRFVHERLDLFKRRVHRVRLFGLTDEIERSYWEVKGLFRGSLLYMVAGMMEREVDEPLLGMQRYLLKKDVYGEMETVRDVEKLFVEQPIWGPIDGPAGRRSSAKKHGDFQHDALIRESIGIILQAGY